MKVTIVPSQITTIEDRIFGNLSLSQLVLLICPIVLSGIIYALLPTFHQITIAKLCVISFITICCIGLAVRFNSEIGAIWLIKIIRYQFRPRRFIYTHSSPYLRNAGVFEIPTADNVPFASPRHTSKARTPKLSIRDVVLGEAIFEQLASRIRFEVNLKGGLNVRIKKTK